MLTIIMRFGRNVVVATLILRLISNPEVHAQEDQSPVVASLHRDAQRLLPLVRSDAAKAFLQAVSHLPEPSSRVIWKSLDGKQVLSDREFQLIAFAGREGWEATQLKPVYYYTTRSGSPLIYARPLDLIAKRWEQTRAQTDGTDQSVFDGRRIFDFGYGTIGHLRLLASLGADCVGSEVNPELRALYSAKEDQGEIEGIAQGTHGRLQVFHGRWPGEARLVEEVGSDFDLIISKNVLKAGYIHPARDVDSRFLVNLGVDDRRFISQVFDALKPGGYFLIYNISPAQNPSDKPYIPWADGQSPFTREQFESQGFVVHAFDQVDQDQIIKWWQALGYDEGKDEATLRRELFAWFTLVQRPVPKNHE